MTSKFKGAFDGIYAEDRLKADTLLRIKNQTRRGRRAWKFTAAAISAVIATFSFLYFSPAAYMSIDINPSVELTVNRFDRIIDTRAYNADGEAVLSALALRHMDCEDALKDIIRVSAQNGLNYSLVSVTLQTNSSSREKEMLRNIEAEIEAAVARSVTVDIFPVNSDTLIHAREQNISPAKYLAVLELIQVDPNESFEHCAGRSISEIKRLTSEHEHRHRHHGGHH